MYCVQPMATLKFHNIISVKKNCAAKVFMIL